MSMRRFTRTIRIGQSDAATSKLDIRVQVAALHRVDGVIAEIEATANKFV